MRKIVGDSKGAEGSVLQDSGAATGSGAGISRRGALGKVLGAAALTVAGGALLVEEASPASAATGDAVLGGELNLAETVTAVKYDGASGYSGVVLLGNDSAYSGTGANYPAGIGGWAGAGSTAGAGGVANGVYGYTDNGAGNGVVGYNSNFVSGAGAGVLGLAFGPDATGVEAINSAGTAVSGTSQSTVAEATAIIGTISSSSPGGFSSAVRGQNNGTGGLGIGVWGSQAGSGWGVYATSVSGIGVLSSGGSGIGVEATGATAVEAIGSTTGVIANGPTGVSASGTGSTGIALSAIASSTQPAVQSSNSGTGYGLKAVSTGGHGIYGQTSANGDVGVYGADISTGGGYGVRATSAKGTGAYCSTTATGKVGVHGADTSTGGGFGVSGTSNAGVGVAATSTTGTALAVTGVATFSRSGTATITGTTTTPLTSVVVTGVSLKSTSRIFTTPQGHVAGIGIAGVVPNVAGNSFTVYLTAAIRVSLPIAWFVVG